MDIKYYSITALNRAIKNMFDSKPELNRVYIKGEISNFKHHSRGHLYFTLKDENSRIAAVMFDSYARKLTFEPEDGMKVLVSGRVTVYEANGGYQIYIDDMQVDGIGNLYLEYEKLKKKLAEEGLFNPEHKKPIPRFPNTVGVITSPTGAAIRDIINTIKRRYPLTKVILYPAIVQGNDAKDNIVMQIKKANIDNLCDVLIVGRGGGSIEDLWAFNEKVVAYAIYNSEIPIISAVGHEIDFTIADFVADIRAATPTAGAEIATPNVDALKDNIGFYERTLTKRITYILNEAKLKLANYDRIIESKNPKAVLKHKREILNNDSLRLNMLIANIIKEKKHHFDILKSQLDSLNPLAIMDKGYSINRVNGKILTDIKDVKTGDTLVTELKNGKVISTVMEVSKNGK
jgi:exodeoxyribonuclease VII large subunit